MGDPDRDAVQARLEALGFDVEPIPEDEFSKRPDLEARAEGSTMYVEVKRREEDRTLRTAMERVPVGATEEIHTDLNKKNALSAVIKQADSQLGEFATETDLRLLWFRADQGLFVFDAKEQIVSTLYGVRIVAVESENGPPRRHCVYAGYSDFFRFREIDGAIIEVDGPISLFPNPFSPRREIFAESPIARLVSGSVFNVDELEEAGRCYVAGPDAPRDDDESLLQHLRAKYPGNNIVGFVSPVAVSQVTTIDARSRGSYE